MKKLIAIARVCFSDMDELRTLDCVRLSPMWVTGMYRNGGLIMKR